MMMMMMMKILVVVGAGAIRLSQTALHTVTQLWGDDTPLSLPGPSNWCATGSADEHRCLEGVFCHIGLFIYHLKPTNMEVFDSQFEYLRLMVIHPGICKHLFSQHFNPSTCFTPTKSSKLIIYKHPIYPQAHQIHPKPRRRSDCRRFSSSVPLILSRRWEGWHPKARNQCHGLIMIEFPEVLWCGLKVFGALSCIFHDIIPPVLSLYQIISTVSEFSAQIPRLV